LFCLEINGHQLYGIVGQEGGAMPEWIISFGIIGAMGLVLFSAIAITKLSLTAMLWFMGRRINK